jgi:hypothetical protein
MSMDKVTLKAFFKDSAERAVELLNSSRNQPGITMGLPTEHCSSNEHP